jgi:hypothetical protein
MEAMVACLSPDVRLPSPLFGTMTFKGREDVGLLLTAVYGLLSDVSWGEPIGDGSKRVVVARAKVAGLRVDDAMYFELDDAGTINSIRPHLRPLLATIVFALLIGPRVAGKRPGVILRALRGS